MATTEQILSDEILKQYLSEEQLKEILNLFSTGKFSEIINKYLMIEDKSQTQVQTPPPNIMFSTPVVQKPLVKYIFNLDLLEKMKEDKLSIQIISTIFIFCLLKMNKMEEVKTILEKYLLNLDNSIFPIIMLKAKFYIKNKNIFRFVLCFCRFFRFFSSVTAFIDSIFEIKYHFVNIFLY